MSLTVLQSVNKFREQSDSGNITAFHDLSQSIPLSFDILYILLFPNQIAMNIKIILSIRMFIL